MVLGPGAFSLAGKVAVITGAAQGIGAAIAQCFAVAGADVAICDRNGELLTDVATRCEAEGRRAWSGVLDVREPGPVCAWVDEVAAAAGRIDVLVNNAGGGFAAAFLDVSDKGQDALVRENFTSVTTMVRAVVPHLPPAVPDTRGGGGSIINITSIEAHRAAPGFAVYAAMKAAVANLTMSLALELGDRHVRVNAIAPDVIPTPGVGELPVRTPLPYPGHVDDVAAAALFLASDASSFVTGSTLYVDGGNRAAGGWRRTGEGAFTT
ncbi:SDR family NAD(P)-dependent oxidoreductase [Rhabdothermincola sp.]|uniref:SDR family NAD(P)-dependent oxidoreductase n=1 Tax=Rhabdothermincola sp. TaxID=2820405 RepID=UPI002FE0AE12